VHPGSMHLLIIPIVLSCPLDPESKPSARLTDPVSRTMGRAASGAGDRSRPLVTIQRRVSTSGPFAGPRSRR